MKSFAFVAVLSVPFLLLAISVVAEDENFVRILIPPRGKYFDSNGKTELTSVRGHHRSVRKPSTCKLPPSLDDSQLDCKLYPSRVQCIQTCMFGHTLADGIQREMKCKYEEDKWTPVPTFEKCKPFVDCTLTITAGGKYKCFTNFMDKGANCDVSCEHYEDKDAVPKANYECDINGKWTPKLPFCARPGTGIKLVPPPTGAKLIPK